MAIISNYLLILNITALFADRDQTCSCANGQFVATRFMWMHQSQHPDVIINQTVDIDPDVLEIDYQDMVLEFSCLVRCLIVVNLGISGQFKFIFVIQFSV